MRSSFRIGPDAAMMPSTNIGAYCTLDALPSALQDAAMLLDAAANAEGRAKIKGVGQRHPSLNCKRSIYYEVDIS